MYITVKSATTKTLPCGCHTVNAKWRNVSSPGASSWCVKIFSFIDRETKIVTTITRDKTSLFLICFLVCFLCDSLTVTSPLNMTLFGISRIQNEKLLKCSSVDVEDLSTTKKKKQIQFFGEFRSIPVIYVRCELYFASIYLDNCFNKDFSASESY